jgi:genome maintenance exonuclease 1
MFTHKPIPFDDLKTVTIDGKRFYQTPEGNTYPSVTSVTGLYNKKEILEWRKRVGEAEANRISTKASSRGTRVHKLCEDYLNNELNTDRYMPDSVGMFKSIQPIIDQYVDNIYAIEAPLYSDHLKVAGRVDCIAEFDGKLSIIDFKTSSRQKSEDKIQNYFMQCAAYAVMFEERTGIPVPRIAIVIAVDSDHPQVFVKKRNDYIGMFKTYREMFDNQSVFS